MGDHAKEHIGGGSVAAMEGAPPLVSDFARFESWLRKHWKVTRWEYREWRDTGRRQYEFRIDWGGHIGWDRGYISGFIPEGGQSIHFRDDSSEYFTLEFVRHFIEKFPHAGGNIVFFNSYGDLARFDASLSDEELLRRIRLDETDEELMQQVSSSSQHPCQGRNLGNCSSVRCV